MEDLTLGLAVIAGLLSFISPCVLPLVPAYIGYMGGRATHNAAMQTAGTQKRKVDAGVLQRANMIVHGLAFVLGFTLVFVAIGLMTTAFVSVVGSSVTMLTEIIGRVGGVIIVLFGLHFMGALSTAFRRLRKNRQVLSSPLVTLAVGLVASVLIVWGFVTPVISLPLLAALWLTLLLGGAFAHPQEFWLPIITKIENTLYADTRGDIQPDGRGGIVGTFFMGVVFSAGWTPCIGPLLGTILTIAANTGDIGIAVPMLTAYSLGLGVPFLLTALLLEGAQGVLRRLQRYMHTIELISGTLLIAIGLLVASGQLQSLSQNLNNQFADFSYRVEECGIGFFSGEVHASHLGSCVGGTLIPVDLGESAGFTFDETTDQVEFLFLAEQPTTIQVELLRVEDPARFDVTLLTDSGEALAQSDAAATQIDEASYLALDAVSLPASGHYRVRIGIQALPETSLRFRMRIAEAQPEETASDGEDSALEDLANEGLKSLEEEQIDEESGRGSGDTDEFNTIEELAESSDLTVGIDEGQLAPDFTVTTIEGETIRLQDLRGQVVLLNFWGTWCGPCRREMPEFQDAYEHRSDEGFTILALAVRDTREAVIDFREEFGLTFPLALDEGETVTGQYGILRQPSTVVIDADGVIRHRIQNIMTAEQLDEILDETLQTVDG